MDDRVTIGIIIVSYLLLVTAVGLLSARMIKGSDDFLVAGRKFGPLLVVAGLTATHLGGGAVMGVSEDSFVYGYSGIAYSAGTAVGLTLLGLLSAKRLRNLSLYTITDFLALRYNSKVVRGLAALLSIVAVTGIVAAQVSAAGGAFQILGINPTIGAAIAVSLFIGYTFFAGMWGVAITDAMQLIIIVIAVPIACVIGLQTVGGFSGLQEFAAASDAVSAETYLSPVGMGVMAMLGVMTPVIMYDLIGQDFYQRLFSARSGKVASASAIMAGVLLILFGTFPVIGGMSARAMFGEDLEDSSSALPMLIVEVLPVWLAAILVAAILAAVMSTADSLLIAGSTHITNDFYRKIMGRDQNGDSTTTLWIARISTLVLGVGALTFALLVPGIIQVLVLAYTMYASGVFIPLILGLFWKRGTKEGAIAAILLGGLAGTSGAVGLVDYQVPDIIIGGAVSLVAFVVVSLLTKAPTEAELALTRPVAAKEGSDIG